MFSLARIRSTTVFRHLVRPRAALCLILLLQATLLVLGAVRHSPTWDEVGHMAAGLSHWKLRTFTLYSVNPPLVRALATAPVAWLCEPTLNWRSYIENTKQRSEVQVGRDFIDDNREHFVVYFTIARLACIPLVLMGTLICFLWSRSLFGQHAGLMAAGTWAFSPMILGHGALITPDVAAASLGLTAFYCLSRWLQASTWANAQLLGITLALALLSKTTWIIAAGIIPIVWITWRLLELRQKRWTIGAAFHDFAQLSFAALMVVILLNTFYGLEGSFRPLGRYEFVSEKLTAKVLSNPRQQTSNRFRGTWLERIPVPLPSAFVEGVDIQSNDLERSAREPGWRSYLFGEWKSGGWWYYYLVGLGVKEPLAWIVLLVGSCALVGLGKLPGCAYPQAAALLFPPLACLALVSSQTDMNRHVRYVLPVLPFLFIWTSQYACCFERGQKVLAWFVGAMAVWFLGGVLWFSPHWLSHFNELAGGPRGGHRILENSNIDWGQDLYYLQDWLKEHPEAKDVKIAYFGCFDPHVLGLRYESPPPLLTRSGRDSVQPQDMGPQPGWYAVSVNYVIGSSAHVPSGKGTFQYWGEPAFSYFAEFEPVDRAGYSIWIYHLTPESVKRVRDKLGLPAWRGGPKKGSSRNTSG